MRLSYFLLATVVALAATPVSAASDLTTTDSGKRFLRSTESNQETEALDSADEERRVNPFPNLKLKIPEIKLDKLKVPFTKKAPVTAYSHPLLRPLDEVLASIKPPQLNKMGQNLQRQMDENIIAKSFVNQFIDEQWPLQTLKQNMGITRKTPKDSEQYLAYILLIQVRSYNNVQAKTGWATKSLKWKRSVDKVVPTLKAEDARKFGKDLQAKLESNPLAKAFAEQHRGQDWSMPLLVKQLGITTETPKYADEYVALWLLRDVQAWNKVGKFKI
ncbi:Avr1b-1 avirulence-like protein [Phytophthora sojae]|uniref:RxLR effector protein n=2 Tax=Phytophthora sojae TaxID=67593 RepID=G4Z2E0_PHYSP|nr:Avr1b-1 avirulence-like protein [Phytophthora sojae]AEK80669.1 Avh105 [Phytophthora sojae]AEK80671.1 Avh105 [Phytophthora sojae]EGZ19981.1 Avr1b-1 avirulence-like protein [Phytophthora sojae]|eukprot:XP_009522698.1 Avr1b-1 avirulence-like protein [Phytophthora sojae]